MWQLLQSVAGKDKCQKANYFIDNFSSVIISSPAYIIFVTSVMPTNVHTAHHAPLCSLCPPLSLYHSLSF